MAEKHEKPKSFRAPVEPETRAERLLADCVLRGAPADVSDFELDADKIVRAAFLRCFCLNAENLNINPRGIELMGARVTGSLDLVSATLDRSLWFVDCTFSDRLNLSEAKGKSLGFLKCTLPGVEADGLSLEGALSFQGVTVTGEMHLLGAKVIGQVNCSVSAFTNEGGEAFCADGIEIGGSLVFQNAKVVGETRLLGAKVGGQVSCTGATFTNDGGRAFSADGLIVEGNISFAGATVVGETRLLGAKVVGQVNCVKATFTNEGRTAFGADHLEVGGSLVFQNAKVVGEARLLGAKVGGQVACPGAIFTQEAGNAFTADGLEVKEALFFMNLTKPVVGRLSLNHASVDSLFADGSGWPEAGLLDLNGFRYRTLGFYHPWTTILGWIGWQVPRGFTPQPYEQAMKVYREAGHLADAREMGIAKEDAYRKQGGLGWWHRAWLLFAKWTIAYGYKPWRAGVWIFYAVMLAWMVFNSAYHQGYMRPAKERVFIHDCFNGEAKPGQCSAWIERKLSWRAEPLRVPEDYPAFNGLMYSLDTFFPFVDFHQEAYWLPFAGDRFGWFFRLWLWVHIIAGWVLSTMAVAGLTGLIKKD